MTDDDRAWIEVDLQKIRRNVQLVQQFVGDRREIMAVVKADAYGHGMIASAKAACDGGATWLGVATVTEAEQLQHHGISKPICLLCPFAPAQANRICSSAIVPTIGDASQLDLLASHNRPQQMPIHLEIDTGMGRSGSLPQHAVAIYRRAVELGFHPQGISTHFSDPTGATDPQLNYEQQRNFELAWLALQEAGAIFRWVHLNASGAIVSLQHQYGNLVRPGLLTFGIQPDTHKLVPEIQAAMTVNARVATVRSLPSGHPISYGGTHRLSHDSKVATVLIGYGDGYPRRLSNKGQVIIHGSRCTILGAVCMDQIVVDVTDVPGVKPGDTATCIGRNGNQEITANEIAKVIGTTVHEIPTTLTSRLPRLYVN